MDYFTEMFLFMCFSSCPGGLNRRPSLIIFTLENRWVSILGVHIFTREYLPWRTGGCPYWVSIFIPESIYLGEQVGVHIGCPYLYQRVFTLENRWVSILGVHIYTREYLPWRTGGCPYWVSIFIPESIYLGEQVGVHFGCPYLYQRVFTLENWWVSKFSVRRWVSILTLENRWVSIYSVFTINGVLTGGCPYLHSEQMGV